MFLFGSAHGIPFFLKGEQHDIVALALACAIDKQIFRDAAQESSGVHEAVPLAASGRPHEHILHQIGRGVVAGMTARSEEHTSELQSLMRISYAVFCLKKKKQNTDTMTA